MRARFLQTLLVASAALVAGLICSQLFGCAVAVQRSATQPSKLAHAVEVRP